MTQKNRENSAVINLLATNSLASKMTISSTSLWSKERQGTSFIQMQRCLRRCIQTVQALWCHTSYYPDLILYEKALFGFECVALITTMSRNQDVFFLILKRSERRPPPFYDMHTRAARTTYCTEQRSHTASLYLHTQPTSTHVIH